jgi:tRNA(fMet)-specific endonuclease VapC
MRYLLDTDHLSILQESTGRDYECLSARMAHIPISDFGISIVTVHEQFLGSHTYINRIRNAQDLESIFCRVGIAHRPFST